MLAKSSLSDNEIHILIEVVKALLTLLVFLIIWKKRKKREKKIDEHIEQSKPDHQQAEKN
jgi:flagellar biosynthesis/type III secretory pathway M-ring protein FliF/YscJ